MNGSILEFPKTATDWDMSLGTPCPTPYHDVNMTPCDVEPKGATVNVRPPLQLDPPTAETKIRLEGHRPPSPAASLLLEAVDLLDGDRAQQHGPKDELHETMAGLMSAILGTCTLPLTAADAAALEICMKFARTRHGQYNKDDCRDGAAYFGIYDELSSTGHR